MRTAGIANASLAAGVGSGAATTLPNRHGMDSDSGYELSASVYWQLGDYFLLSGGVVAYDGDATPTGSMLSIGHEYAQVDVGYRDHWLSPFTDSAMLLEHGSGDDAVDHRSRTTRRSAAWSLSYELFMAEMSESSNIAFEDGFTSGNPRARRRAYFDRAVSRAGRSASAGSCSTAAANAAIRWATCSMPSSILRTTTTRSAATTTEFGNQVAALSSRFLFPGKAAVRGLFRVRRRRHVDAQQSAARQHGAVGRHRLSDADAQSLADASKSANGKTAGMCTGSTATACATKAA